MPASSRQLSVTECGTGLTDVAQGLCPSWLLSFWGGGYFPGCQAPEQPLHRLREGPLLKLADRPGVGSSLLQESPQVKT